MRVYESRTRGRDREERWEKGDMVEFPRSEGEAVLKVEFLERVEEGDSSAGRSWDLATAGATPCLKAVVTFGEL